MRSHCCVLELEEIAVGGQRLAKHVPAATNTRNNRRTVGVVVFYTVCVESKESLCVCL
jgi:hypothetical protein